ncbi:MAG: exodeoxyribonuclease V subunit beta [Acidobacteria bacterium]|nr:exodeoxyribonuclease V subunit beta [Acidobacteriota bacterium]
MTVNTERGDAFNRPIDADLLIEASAGTGKTYALTTLVARLIVEEDLRIDRLLIVTFTISAAGELRTRVRQLLQEARRAASGAGVDADSQAGKLRRRWPRCGIRDAEALERLTRAVRDLDRANITTIHGFCQRTLVEFALHAGTPFSFEVSGDDALAVGDATRDFWRRGMVGEPVPLLEYAKSKRFVQNEDTTTWVAGHHARAQDIRGVCSPEELPGVLESKREKWLEAVRAARNAWSDPAQKQAFLEVADPNRWKKTGRPKDLGVRARTIIETFDAGVPEELAPDSVGTFGSAALRKGLPVNNPPPSVPLFHCFDRVAEAGKEYGDIWLASRRSSLLEDARRSLEHATEVDRSLSFDALLVELHRALVGAGGTELARRIRSRYPVALIDEFQDTDRLQARIFETIYPAGAGEAEGLGGRLFVVGDKKQSIYRFRGADVFAYLEAQKRPGASGEPLSLEHNFRSTPELIRAVNELFARPRPFVLADFPFAPAAPADRERVELRVQDEEDDGAPFQLVLIPGTGGRGRSKPKLTTLAADLAARDIARLIALGKEGRATLAGGDRSTPLAARDIAVLVRKGDQGKEVAEALRRLGIGSVEMGTDNIFQSEEAGCLHRLLHALCLDESEHNATQLLRGALAADLFGLDMRALAALRDDDDTWGEWRGLTWEWAEDWQEHGIATLMRRILFAGDRTDCSANLLAYPNGPRRLTNYLHLTDLLHEAEVRRRPSRQGLLDWFRQARTDAQGADETAQLRLESDENLVKIVTAHRAKGLEFPVVFYPFAWDGRRPPSGGQRQPTAEYYDAKLKTPVLDLRPSDDAYDREHIEEHADELRLLYVALTRAEHRCVVTWSPDGQAEHAPLSWLLHGREGSDDDATAAQDLKDHAARVNGLGAGEWYAEVEAFANRAPEAVSLRLIDDEEAEAAEPAAGDEQAVSLEVRTLERPLERIRQRTSYSALSAGGGGFVRDRDEVDLPDSEDAAVEEEAPASASAPEEEGPTVFTFPAGGRSGRCLHHVFERHLGNPEAGSLERTCEAALIRYGVQDKWLQAVRTLVENGLETPLAPPGEAGGVFRLSDLQQPIVEMEFHLPLGKLRREQLARCLEEHGYEHRIAADDGQIDGFLHGFIDLVAQHDGRWYVIDYKSNWLGPDLASYSKEAIAQAMRHHGYHLQYVLYLAALHRLLALRLPDYDYDRHIGGAFYLFLRGMRPNAPGSGVFHDRPSRACIEAINACFGEAP